jgi:hypothetical protein
MPHSFLTERSGASASQGSGGEHLSQSGIRFALNSRDFSKLLLLAAGTMFDTTELRISHNVCRQRRRGVTSVFALDGADTTDPDGWRYIRPSMSVHQEVQSSSGVMLPRSVTGPQATNVVTKSGTAVRQPV